MEIYLSDYLLRTTSMRQGSRNGWSSFKLRGRTWAFLKPTIRSNGRTSMTINHKETHDGARSNRSNNWHPYWIFKISRRRRDTSDHTSISYTRSRFCKTVGLSRALFFFFFFRGKSPPTSLATCCDVFTFGVNICACTSSMRRWK